MRRSEWTRCCEVSSSKTTKAKAAREEEKETKTILVSRKGRGEEKERKTNDVPARRLTLLTLLENVLETIDREGGFEIFLKKRAKQLGTFDRFNRLWRDFRMSEAKRAALLELVFKLGDGGECEDRCLRTKFLRRSA